MIIQKYESIRKAASPPPPPPKDKRHPTAPDRARALQFGILPDEFVRRDDIVRQMWLDCEFKVGEVCEPVGEIAREMYGKCTIKKIFHSYHDFPVAEATSWPKDDRPLIVTAEPEKKPDGAKLICCTPKFLQRCFTGVCG